MIKELGHFTPQFTILYLLLNAFHTTENTQKQYIYLFFVSLFDYALLGPYIFKKKKFFCFYIFLLK